MKLNYEGVELTNKIERELTDILVEHYDEWDGCCKIIWLNNAEFFGVINEYGYTDILRVDICDDELTKYKPSGVEVFVSDEDDNKQGFLSLWDIPTEVASNILDYCKKKMDKCDCVGKERYLAKKETFGTNVESSEETSKTHTNMEKKIYKVSKPFYFNPFMEIEATSAEEAFALYGNAVRKRLDNALGAFDLWYLDEGANDLEITCEEDELTKEVKEFLAKHGWYGNNKELLDDIKSVKVVETKNVNDIPIEYIYIDTEDKWEYANWCVLRIDGKLYENVDGGAYPSCIDDARMYVWGGIKNNGESIVCKLSTDFIPIDMGKEWSESIIEKRLEFLAREGVHFGADFDGMSIDYNDATKMQVRNYADIRNGDDTYYLAKYESINDYVPTSVIKVVEVYNHK